jgi:hypothetical protein
LVIIHHGGQYRSAVAPGSSKTARHWIVYWASRRYRDPVLTSAVVK